MIAFAAAACLLAGCVSPSAVGGPLETSRADKVDHRVAELLPSAGDLGFPERDSYGLPTVDTYSHAGAPHCGVSPVASGGIGAVDGADVLIEKVFVYAKDVDAQQAFERVVSGRCADWPKHRKIDLPPLGDRSHGYRRMAGYPQGSYGAWVLTGRNVLHVVTADKASLHRFAIAAASAAGA